MWSAAILAGGRATRFGGRDKSALIVGGRSILERQVAALSPLTSDIMLVTSAGAGPAPEFARGSSNASLPLRRVRDRLSDRGPLGGLEAALRAAVSDRVLLLACDMPLVTTPFLEHLLRLTDTSDAVVPETARGRHPLCAAYTRGCLDAVTARLDAGHLAMTGMLERVRVRVVTTADIERFGDPHRILANLNTPADLEDLEALCGHER